MTGRDSYLEEFIDVLRAEKEKRDRAFIESLHEPLFDIEEVK